MNATLGAAILVRAVKDFETHTEDTLVFLASRRAYQYMAALDDDIDTDLVWKAFRSKLLAGELKVRGVLRPA